ncbi:hypothetical protein THAOC_13865 [Thalassiosira oceanica]|uniref:Thioredoxin domain-containing protein n=1 Tax=Thalassiosira oceanica TaxID=159749 RepID=K0T4K7_THAOC|nr:hypothetical protein THAOC_13865 [Thalassiosira oceanica]|eukprot:EJK65292.1 hypothetical protein THAOC_13865 [Thalassiosira oceanica]
MASASRPFGVTSGHRSRRFLATRTTLLNIRGGAVHESQTISDLESRLQTAALQNKLTVIDFTVNLRCGPCKQIAPIYKDLSDEYGSRAQFLKVDVDTNQAAAQKFKVSSMPTFLFIKGGEVVDQMVGANPQRLRELIDELAF